MSLLNLISDKEKDMMHYYISRYGAKDSDSAPIESMDYILRFWDEAKSKYLYKIFGDNLILEKTISFEKDPEELQEDIRMQITDTWYSDSAKDCKEFIEAWNEVADKIATETQVREIYWAMHRLIMDSSLASNRYGFHTQDIPLPDGKNYRISEGCKVSKAIGKIANAYNIPGYETFRIRHSQVLNQKSITGTLCLSIHPLDYMTMSDNDCGWSSCMSWYDHGDYRQGTVEMMNSDCVIVAYLKSSTGYSINSFNGYFWNSKRWRELFIIHKGVLAGIKGYPYWNENLEATVLKWIAELATNAGIGVYQSDIKEYDGNDKTVNLGDEYIDLNFHTHLMYNDFYTKHQIILAEDRCLIPQDINYSGNSECMCCGDILYDYDTEQDLYCFKCDDAIQCSECGEYHSADQMIELDGYWYCEYCYQEVFASCDCGCDNIVRTEDLTPLYLGTDDEHIWGDKAISVCYDCITYGNDLFDAHDIHKVQTGKYRWQATCYIHPDDISDAGLELFDLDRESVKTYESKFFLKKTIEDAS